MSSNLSTTISGIKLKNPLVLASGIMGVSPASLKMIENGGAGAVTMKSIGPTERHGNKNPTVFVWDHGLINAVGLSNPGINASIPIFKEMQKELSIPVFASTFAGTVGEFVANAEKFTTAGAQMLELNLSCPNTENDLGRMFALDIQKSVEVVTRVKKVVGTTKIFVKLTPDNADIVDVAKAVEAAGADGITAVNTFSGLIIEPRVRRPILSNKFGGLSGPAIKPVAVRAVYNIYKAVKIPIIGVGGVMSGLDAAEFIMAGASAVGVGSAIYYRGIDVFKKITDELSQFMQEEGFKTIDEMKGVAHEN